MSDKLLSQREVELTNLLAHIVDEKAAVMRENERFKQFIYDILAQCLNDFSDPYIEGKEHKETMKHCYDQISAFAMQVPEWGNWNKGSSDVG